MQKDLKKYLNGSEWHIAEQGCDPSKQNIGESLFSLGNGYVGSRGVLEELPIGSQPGTYFSGLFDSTCAQVSELINAPNPISLQVAKVGEKLGVAAMEILDHERILDMSKGVLYRRTVFQTAITKERILYQSIRFFSMANPHAAVMRVVVTPLDRTTSFTVKSAIDTSVSNAGFVTEGPKTHFLIHDYASHGRAKYFCTKTLESETLLAYAAQLTITLNKRTRSGRRKITDLVVEKGQSIILTKYFSLLTSREVPPSKVKQRSFASLKRYVAAGFDKLLERHSRAWTKLWKQSDIKIEGDPELLRAVRYNIYSLLIAGSQHLSDDASIGARCLSGEGYRGHVFWDAATFVLPFFTFVFPDISKKLLLYRYRRLDAARANAKKRGHEGAMFPWESADTGEDVTPTWHKDLDGRIIKIHTMEQEQHITADIAYAVWQYYQATNDDDFFLDYGLEMILETARFWNSRMTFDKKFGGYVINGVIGPDEFHDNVNNNAYTNVMAGWNLLIAGEALKICLKKFPEKVKKLIKRLKLSQQAIKKWHKVADSIYIPYKKNGKLLEQFEGFLKKRKHPLPKVDKSGLPSLPAKIPLEKIGATQFSKQADVVLLLFLLPSLFSEEFIHDNFCFYEARALHKSSLSPSTHAAVAARLGLYEKACRYLQISARMDLDNIFGNTKEGIHAAALGGTWQAVVMGFGGMKIENGYLSFSPRLPPEWEKLFYRLHWQGRDLEVFLKRKEVSLRWRKPKGKKGEKEPLSVYVFGELKTLKPGRWVGFPKPDRLSMKKTF
ncbi:MAG: glycoside hydrolase family 65 protein [Waddliaceae bacterium]